MIWALPVLPLYLAAAMAMVDLRLRVQWHGWAKSLPMGSYTASTDVADVVCILKASCLIGQQFARANQQRAND